MAETHEGTRSEKLLEMILSELKDINGALQDVRDVGSKVDDVGFHVRQIRNRIEDWEVSSGE